MPTFDGTLRQFVSLKLSKVPERLARDLFAEESIGCSEAKWALAEHGKKEQDQFGGHFVSFAPRHFKNEIWIKPV